MMSHQTTNYLFQFQGFDAESEGFEPATARLKLLSLVVQHNTDDDFDCKWDLESEKQLPPQHNNGR